MALNWKNIGRYADKALDAANEIRDGYRDGMEIADRYERAQEYINSEQRQKEHAKAQRIERVDGNIIKFFVGLWILIILCTIILCVMENDIILRLIGM